jgi:hypothetical protein
MILFSKCGEKYDKHENGEENRELDKASFFFSFFFFFFVEFNEILAKS